jgi:hypothetical protein
MVMFFTQSDALGWYAVAPLECGEFFARYRHWSILRAKQKTRGRVMEVGGINATIDWRYAIRKRREGKEEIMNYEL